MNYFLKKKKWLAWVIMLTFLFTSFMPSNIMAGNSVAEAAEASSSQQIKNQGGNNNDKAYQTFEDENLKIRKTIEGTNTENKFNISLEVVTTENLNEIPSDPNAAVVLVMDCSGSMANNNRKTSLKNAARNFINGYANISNATRNITFITFSNHAEAEGHWYNVADSTTKDTVVNKYFPSQGDGKLLYAKGGTNIDAGLQLAYNLINAEKAKMQNNTGAFCVTKDDGSVEKISNVSVILLTDGVPTFHIATNGYSDDYQNGNRTGYLKDLGRTAKSNKEALDKIYGTKGGGNEASREDYSPVETLASNIQNITVAEKKVQLYNISFGASGTVHDKDVFKWLKSLAKTFTASNQNDLIKVFEAINTLITLGIEAWKVEDPLGADIVYDEANYSDQFNSLNYTAADKKLIWDLTKSVPSKTTSADGKTNYYTYKVTYPVILDTSKVETENGESKNTFEFSQTKVTNGITTLYYYLFSQVDQDDPQYGKLQEKTFKVPSVKGYAGSLEFTKKAAELGNLPETALPGAKFKLEGTATGTGETVTLTATSATNGKVSFANIPAGVYTLTETQAPRGYIPAENFSKQVVVSYGNTTIDGETSLGDVLNERETVNVPVEKVWSGVEAGAKLPAVTFELYRDGQATETKLTQAAVNAYDPNASYGVTFTNLPKYDTDGRAYIYTVKEEVVPGYTSGATTTAVGIVNGKVTITNTFADEKVNVPVEKVWSGVEAGVKLPAVTFELYRDGQATETKLTQAAVNAYDPNASYGVTFTNLPKYDTDGRAYVYTVKEEVVPGYTSGATTTAVGIVNGKVTITNTFADETVSVPVEKVWSGVEAGVKLPAVTFELYRDGQATETKLTQAAVNAYDPNASYGVTFTNLPKYDTDGRAYIYTVKEEVVPGYTSGATTTAVGIVNGKVTITNTFADETVNVPVEKVWSGVEAGVKLPAVTFELYRDGQATETKLTQAAVNAYDPNASYGVTFTNLPKYDTDGRAYIYTVKEEVVPGYTSGATTTAVGIVNGKVTITNTFADETVSVPVEKVWSGVEAGVKLPAVTFELYRDGQATETKLTQAAVNAYDPNASYGVTFTNLPKYDTDGRAYIYTVKEEVVPGYTSGATTTAVGIVNGKVTITNTFADETVSVPVEKVWSGVEAGVKLPAVTFELYRDGQATETKLTQAAVNAYDPNASYGVTFTNLPKYDTDGRAYIYTVKEEVVPGYTSGATTTAVGIVNGKVTITNTFADETVSVPVEKVWSGVEAGVKLPAVTFELYRDGQATETKLTQAAVNAYDPNASYGVTFTNLPKYDTDGRAYIYTVKEEVVPGYTSGATTTAVGIVNGKVTITNTFADETVNVPVEKVWSGVEAGVKLPAVTFELYRDGQATETKLTQAAVNAYDPNASYGVTFTNLPKYDTDGRAYVYTVKEEVVPGYTSGATTTAVGIVNGKVTITNTFADETVSVPVEKVWSGVEAGVKLPAVTFELYRDGQATETKLTQAAVNAYDPNASYGVTFTNLPKYDTDGRAYIYTVKEEVVPGYTSGATTTAVGIVNGKVTITNTFADETVSVPVEKVWSGVEAGVKLPAVTFELYRDGQATETKLTQAAVNAYDPNASYGVTFTNLPKYDTDGRAYIYTVKEEVVPGYTSGATTTAVGIVNGKVTITNTYTGGETFSISGLKKWVAPEEIKMEDFVVTIGLKQNGNLFDTREVSTTTNWTYEFTGLPYYAPSGEAYEYKVAELDVPENFESKVVPVGENEFNIVNTFKRADATTNVTVQKIWNDLGTNVTTHSAITVDLFQNDMKYGTVTLSDEFGWNHVFEGLPKYDANQQPYKYSVQEQAIAGYTARVYDMSMLSADSGLTFVIENTLVLGKPGEITVTKKVTGDKQPPADTPFKFELQIEVYRPAGTNVLFAASALADLTLDRAANNVNDAISSLRAESMLTTGSQYQYEYLLTERENEFADAMAVMAMDATSPSAIIFDTDEQFAVTQPENEEYEMKANLLDTIVDLLNDLSIERAQDLTNETMEEVLVDIFEQLAEQLELPEGCTMALDKETVENLIVAAVAYDNTLNSYEEENQPIETTTPSALQLFMNGKAVTPSALIFVETETGGYYKYEFELLDGKSAIFGVQATTGSAIRYNIVERLTDATSGENYVGTEILFGTDGKVDGVTLGWTDFEESQVMGYTVVNKYANNPYIPPVDPVDPVDPGDDPDIEIPDEDVPLTDPEEPVIEIEDPDVPLIDVPGEEVEIDEPEVPLGDAPQTGDNSNTIPFVVLMLAAACGLVVTRRKFN